MRSKNSKTPTARERAHLLAVKTCSECDKPAIARGLCQTHYMRLRRAGLLEPMAKESDVDYVRNRVVIDGDGHWLWQNSTREGYGRVARRCSTTTSAHVFSFIAHGGVIVEGQQVNHTCHVRACVNPEHLYSGTQEENMRDMRNAGRSSIRRGSDNGMSKINESVAKLIRNSSDDSRVLASKYGVSRSLVYAIRKGKVWSHA